MSRKFGETLIRIKSIRAFADHVAAVLSARSYYFNAVQYNDLKLFRLRTLKKNLGGQDRR
jgi:hypothetical protein